MGKNNEMEFDKEWVHLMVEARNLGITSSEVRTFLNNANKKMEQS